MKTGRPSDLSVKVVQNIGHSYKPGVFSSSETSMAHQAMAKKMAEYTDAHTDYLKRWVNLATEYSKLSSHGNLLARKILSFFNTAFKTEIPLGKHKMVGGVLINVEYDNLTVSEKMREVINTWHKQHKWSPYEMRARFLGSSGARIPSSKIEYVSKFDMAMLSQDTSYKEDSDNKEVKGNARVFNSITML